MVRVMHNPYNPTHPIYGAAFARDREQRQPQTPTVKSFPLLNQGFVSLKNLRVGAMSTLTANTAP